MKYIIKKKDLLKEMLIDEGLIKTTDIHTTVRNLRTWTKGKDNQPIKIFYKEEFDLNSEWGINFFKVDFKSLIDDYKDFLVKTNNYGWFPSTIEVIHKEHGYGFYKFTNEVIENFIDDLNVKFLLVKFEPKYDFEYKNITKLYHITEQSKINKILKIGLSPKTNSKISEHPERIYFLIKPFLINDLVGEFKKIKDVEYCLLEINLPENNDIKFHRDVNMDWAVYTLKNINPEYVSVKQCDL